MRRTPGATIHRSARVTLHWQVNVKQYVGSMGGVEFLTMDEYFKRYPTPQTERGPFAGTQVLI